MRICIIGKYPPIEGGVSAKTYRLAHCLAQRGHEVHVVTNAREVEDAYRIEMRPQDNQRCEARFDRGFVQLHWTPPADQEQQHVPWHNPFVTKLSGLAVDVVREHRLECILSYYLEPYAVAGRLASEITRRPHVIKTAGSDVGRLWNQPHFSSLYDHLFLNAGAVIAAGRLATKLLELGVDPGRIVAESGPYVPLDEFQPEGPSLKLSDWCQETPEHRFGTSPPVVGIFGKLGPHKGLQALLPAVRKCVDSGHPVVLAAMVSGKRASEDAFRSMVADLDLDSYVYRIPFLPHWRVPEFLRLCSVVCCLEQGFPIRAHAPVVAQEAMATGTRLVMSHEIAAKQPNKHLLVHGFNAFIVRNTDDSDEIADSLRVAAYDSSSTEIGPRAREYVEGAQSEVRFPDAYEEAIEIALGRSEHARSASRAGGSDLRQHGLYLLLKEIHHIISMCRDPERTAPADVNSPEAEEFYRSILDSLAGSNSQELTVSQLARFALQLLAARNFDRSETSSFFRFAGGEVWRPSEVARYIPSLSGDAIVEKYSFNPMAMLTDPSDEPAVELYETPTTILALPMGGDLLLRVYSLDRSSELFLQRCDGRRSVGEIASAFGGQDTGEESEKIPALATKLFLLGILHLSTVGEGSPSPEEVTGDR